MAQGVVTHRVLLLVALGGVAAGVVAGWSLGAAATARARAAAQHWQDSTGAIYAADTARLAAAGRARVAELAELAARAERLDAELRVARRVVGEAQQAEAGSRQARDAVVATLALTSEEVDRLRSVVAEADQAHDQTVAALEAEITSLRDRLDAEIVRSAALSLALAADSAVAGRHVARIAELEAAAARRPASAARVGRLGLGCVVGPTLGAGGPAWLGLTCGLTVR